MRSLEEIIALNERAQKKFGVVRLNDRSFNVDSTEFLPELECYSYNVSLDDLFDEVPNERYKSALETLLEEYYRQKEEAEVGRLVEEHHMLLNLLAVIHRDGGQYTEEVGVERSVKAAIVRVEYHNASPF